MTPEVGLRTLNGYILLLITSAVIRIQNDSYDTAVFYTDVPPITIPPSSAVEMQRVAGQRRDLLDNMWSAISLCQYVDDRAMSSSIWRGSSWTPID